MNIKTRFQTRLTTQFTGYVIILLMGLFVTLGILVLSASFLMDQRLERHQTYTFESILKDYETQGIFAALNNTDGLVDYIEKINGDRRVIEEAGSPNYYGYQYSLQEYDNLFKDYAQVITYYPNPRENILFVIKGPKLIAPPQMWDLMVYHVLAFVLVTGALVVVFMYAIRTWFVKPILLIKSGVKNIATGDYYTDIPYQSMNELNVLKESILDMAATIKRQIDQLHKAKKDRNHLVLSLSHDIRTPLTNIAGYSETLLSEDTDPSVRNKALQVIQSNAMIAKDLINALFDFAKYESDDLKVDNFEHDIVKVLQDILIAYYPHVEANDMDFDIQLPECPCMVTFDDDLFKRLIGNLISNALRYAKKPGCITVSLESTPSQILVNVSDIGPGLPEVVKRDLFKPFVTGDTARTKGSGTGLGLVVTKKLAERIGASLELDESYRDGVCWLVKFNKTL